MKSEEFVCNKCGESKPEEEFPLHRGGSHGTVYRRAACRGCLSIQNAEAYQRRKAKAAAAKEKASESSDFTAMLSMKWGCGR